MHFLFPLNSSIENFKEMQQRLQASELMNFSEGFNAAFLALESSFSVQHSFVSTC